MTSTAGVGNSHYKRRELPIHGAQVDDITQAPGEEPTPQAPEPGAASAGAFHLGTAIRRNVS